jgi:hypothetical protein
MELREARLAVTIPLPGITSPTYRGAKKARPLEQTGERRFDLSYQFLHHDTVFRIGLFLDDVRSVLKCALPGMRAETTCCRQKAEV